jgi:hypothetical protein
VAAELSAAIERTGVSFPVLLDPELTAFHDYGVIALPSTVVIDNNGIITSSCGLPPSDRGWQISSLRQWPEKAGRCLNRQKKVINQFTGDTTFNMVRTP